MIKKYKVELGRYTGGIVYVHTLDEVREYAYDPERYFDNCRDQLAEAIDENYSGWDINGRSWTATELLEQMDDDLLYDMEREDAEYHCNEDLPYEYDDELEEMCVGDMVEINETNVRVYLEEVIPEDEDEAEELGIDFSDLKEEAAALL